MPATQCATCGKKASLLCSWCKSVNYCRQKCQKRDWKQHKEICKWSLNKNSNQTSTPSPSPPHFIQIAPGVWHHPPRPSITKIEQYRKFAALEIDDHSENEESEPIIHQTNKINRNTLSTIIRQLPSTINNQQLSKTIISFNAGPLRIISDESLPIIIKKSVYIIIHSNYQCIFSYN